jgi:hypothetical protein
MEMHAAGFAGFALGREVVADKAAGLLFFRERKMARACIPFWKKCPFLSPCCIYTLLKCKGVFGGLDKVVPIPFLG